jgi:serine phosphatase RsbU (regulator of sigma subunit)
VWDWIVIGALAIALAALGAWLAVLLARGRKAQQRFEILAEVAAVSDAAGSLEETFDAICDILVPAVADICAIDVIEPGQVRRAALGTAPGVGPEVEPGLRGRHPSVPAPMVEDEDAAALRPRFIERVSEQELRELAHDDADFEFLRGLGVRSTITVALQARRRVKGALTLSVAWSGRRYSADDAHFAWILSGRVALALDNSGLFADLERAEGARAEIAETLQHGLLPAPLPHIPGWSLAAMYRPAGAENEVGGDFYDAFRIAGGWMLVVGDVTGRGARAASITALARYTLRTAAELTDDPLVALTTLNRALLARHDASLCSIVALSLSEDPADPVRIAVAGHPPPLLVHGDHVSEVACADPVLGAFDDVQWEISERRIELGQQLVVVTDGIIEANGKAGRFGEERLHAELAGTGNPAHAVQRLEAALRSFVAGVPDDDAAILAIARAPNGPAAAKTALAASSGESDG